MVSTRARVSIQNRFWTRVFFLASLRTLKERAIVVSNTSPDGIIPKTAATTETTASLNG